MSPQGEEESERSSSHEVSGYRSPVGRDPNGWPCEEEEGEDDSSLDSDSSQDSHPSQDSGGFRSYFKKQAKKKGRGKGGTLSTYGVHMDSDMRQWHCTMWY